MRTFSIAELEQYSLIKAHTFRMWEKRHNLFTTRRTATNIRFYTVDELSFLLDLSLLNRLGSKISQLAKFNSDHLRAMTLDLKHDAGRQENQVNRLLVSMFSFDTDGFEQVLDESILCWGIDQTVEEVILPFLERTSFLPDKNHLSGECRFAVTMLRHKLILAIEKVSHDRPLEKLALLFLPKGDHHELLLLYVNYRLKKQGLSTLYLGVDTSADVLYEITKRKRPDYLVTHFSDKNKKQLHAITASRLLEATAVPLYVSTTTEPTLLPAQDKRTRFISYKEIGAVMARLMQVEAVV